MIYVIYKTDLILKKLEYLVLADELISDRMEEDHKQVVISKCLRKTTEF